MSVATGIAPNDLLATDYELLTLMLDHINTRNRG